MSNILSDWRAALVTHLQTNLQDGDWQVRAGERDGPVRDRKLAVVFVPDLPTETSDVEFARPSIVIRAWLPRSKQPKPTEPLDPSDLEQLAVDLETCLQPVQSTLLDGIVFWVADVKFDYVDWGVQATLTSWAINPATIA